MKEIFTVEDAENIFLPRSGIEKVARTCNVWSWSGKCSRCGRSARASLRVFNAEYLVLPVPDVARAGYLLAAPSAHIEMFIQLLTTDQKLAIKLTRTARGDPGEMLLLLSAFR